MLEGPLHELCPNRQRGSRSLQFQWTIVVETDPYNADQLRTESRKPPVMRGSRLTGHREMNSAAPDPRACPAAHHFFEQTIHQERDPGVQHLFVFNLGRVNLRSMRIADPRNEIRL